MMQEIHAQRKEHSKYTFVTLQTTGMPDSVDGIDTVELETSHTAPNFEQHLQEQAAMALAH